MDESIANSAHCCEVEHQHQVFEEKTGKWDRVGIFLSSLCAVHCLLAPVLIFALPFAGEFFHNDYFHLGMALFVVPVAFFAFLSGYKHHNQKLVVAIGLLGALMIGGASVLPHEWVEFYEMDVVTISGSLLLIIGHILNRRACRCETHSHHHSPTPSPAHR